MRFLARAGLAVIFITSLVVFGAAAPVPSRHHSSVAIQCAPSLSTSNQQPFVVSDTNSCVDHQDYAASQNTGGVASREELEMVVLVRRKSIFTKIKEAFQRLGRGIKHIAQKIGQGIKHVAQKIGSGIKKVAQKIGHGIKKVAQKIGHGIKIAAQRVGHFIKTTGAKIAKVGLKIISTIGKTVGKVLSFIPVVGKVVGKAVEGVSEGLNKASDAIHAKIGGKLGKAMAGMSKVQKVEGYIP